MARKKDTERDERDQERMAERIRKLVDGDVDALPDAKLGISSYYDANAISQAFPTVAVGQYTPGYATPTYTQAPTWGNGSLTTQGTSTNPVLPPPFPNPRGLSVKLGRSGTVSEINLDGVDISNEVMSLEIKADASGQREVTLVMRPESVDVFIHEEVPVKRVLKKVHDGARPQERAAS